MKIEIEIEIERSERRLQGALNRTEDGEKERERDAEI